MNILFIGSTSSWHNDLWLKYFANNHNVFIFSDKAEPKKNLPRSAEVMRMGLFKNPIDPKTGKPISNLLIAYIETISFISETDAPQESNEF